MQPIIHPCPNCGQSYTLEQSYLAQYGGQTTICTSCQQPFVLPTAQQAMQQSAYQQPVLGYASQVQPVAAVPAWREGPLLVVADRTTLPDLCVKCGQPGSGKQFKRTYYWHHPAIYFVILVNLIVYAIVAICVRKKGTIHVSLCQQHRSSRSRNQLIGWLVFLSSIGFWMAAAMVQGRDLPAILVIAGIIMFLAGVIIIAFSSRILWPAKIDQGYLRLKGANEGFLANFGSGGGGYGQGFPVQFTR